MTPNRKSYEKTFKLIHTKKSRPLCFSSCALQNIFIFTPAKNYWPTTECSKRYLIESTKAHLSSNVNLLSVNFTKWSNKLKELVGKSRQIVWVCLTILWGWQLKGLGMLWLTQSLKKIFHPCACRARSRWMDKSRTPILKNIRESLLLYRIKSYSCEKYYLLAILRST